MPAPRQERLTVIEPIQGKGSTIAWARLTFVRSMQPATMRTPQERLEQVARLLVPVFLFLVTAIGIAMRLATARMIYLIGLRRSYPAIAYLAYAFSKLGVAATQLGSPSGIDAEILSFSQPEDALLAISFSPYAAGTVALARDAQARGTPVVAITDSPFSPLVEFASPWLEVVEADFEGFRSPAATFALAMSLAVAVAERRAG